MYPSFSKNEAIAILSIVIDVVLVDGHIDSGEVEYVQLIANRLNLTERDIQEAKRLQPADVAPVLRVMSYDKRKVAAGILLASSLADGYAAHSEVAVMSMIIDNCNLPDLDFDPTIIQRVFQDWLNS